MTRADGRAAPCPRCAADAPGEAEISKHLEGYVASLPETMRVDDGVYARRLQACEICALRVGPMCGVCGCYVQARAAKRAMRCPKPGGAEWEREE